MLWWRVLAGLSAAATVALVLWTALRRDRAGRRPAGGERAESRASAVLDAVALAHVAASYAAMLGLWALAAARGAPPGKFVCAAAAAPVIVPVWLLLVTPAVWLDSSGRISANLVPGVANEPLAVVAAAVYSVVFASAYRTVHARRLRRRRRALGLCPGCGYDLTGNVSGVCPECGEPRPG